MKIEDYTVIMDKLKAKLTEPDDIALLMRLEQDYNTVLADNEKAVNDAKQQKERADKFANLNSEMWAERNQKGGSLKDIEAQENKDNNNNDDNTPPEHKTYGEFNEALMQELLKAEGGNL